ncbi:MAG TPA: translocation/assembly module TamB domain-containing protein [Candidatus Kapabacteria bacterium]|nr:translocation/assembly module TamB domain-containing protein [Candidatus Kapabacteria bacterium]
MPEQEKPVPGTAPDQPAVKPPSRFWRYVRRALLVLFLLLLLIIAATQTSPFRNFLRAKLLEIVSEETNATISIGYIGGNFITGTTIENVSVKLKNDTTTLAQIKEISLRYSLWSLIFSKDIAITEIWLDSPTVNLFQAKGDSVWNIAKLLKPSAPSTDKTPFLQTIKLKHFGISYGTFNVFNVNDSSAPASILPYDNPRNKKTVRYSNLKLQNVMLMMSGKTEGENVQYANIEHLSFTEANSLFNLNHLSLIATRDHSNVEIKDLHLITDLSNIKLDASMKPIAVLDGKPYDSLGSAATHVKISATSVSQLDLAQWIPNLAFLGSSSAFDFDADGPYSDLRIKLGRLDFGSRGLLTFGGEVKNLHNPSQIYFDVELTGKNLTDNTLHSRLPGLKMPDLRGYGNINISKLTYKGTPKNFASIFSIKTGTGSVDGKAEFDFRGQQPTYLTDLKTESLNLAPIVSDSSMRSNLNLSVHAKGSSFDIHQMNTAFVIDADQTSSFYKFNMAKLHLGGSMQNGTANVEKSSVAFADGSSINANYATIGITDSLLPYECDVSALEVPIAKYVPAFPQSASVNANATLSGKIKSIGTIEGSLHTVIAGLTYHQDTLAPILLTATLQYNDSLHGRTDIFASDIADLKVQGTYDVEKLGVVLSDRLNALSHSFDKAHPDSDSHFAPRVRDSSARFRKITCDDSLHCEFMMDLKDLRPLDHFLPGMTLLARGKLDGSIIGCPKEAMDVRLDGTLKHLLVKPYGDDSIALGIPTIVARQLQLRIGLRNLVTNTEDALAAARGGVRISSDSMLYVAGIGITQPFAAIRLDNDSIRYTIAANIEDKTFVRFKGNASVIGATKGFVFDSVRVRFSDAFEWNNEYPATLSFSNTGLLKLDSLTLIRPEASLDPGNKFAQRITLGAQIEKDSIKYAFLHSTLLRVEELPKFVSNWFDISSLGTMRGRLQRFDLDMKGTLAHPTIETNLGLKNITYSSVTIDTGRIALKYADNTLRGNINIHVDSDAFAIESIRMGREKIVPSRANKLDIAIDSVPVIFSLQNYPQRKADSIRNATRPLSLRVETKDFPLDIFGPFIPLVSEFHGLGDVAFTTKGTLEKIEYGGDVNIRHGSFLLPFTNIRYNIEGPIRLSNAELIFDNLSISNVAADDPKGTAKLDGRLFFKGFKLDSMRFHLNAPRLLVLNDASRETLKTIYGPLTIQTGPAPLTFYGTMDEPHLDGDINVLQAYLTLPPTVSAAQLQNDGITYVIATTTVPVDSIVEVDTFTVRKPPQRDYEEEAFMAEVSPRVPTKDELPDVGPLQPEVSSASFKDKMLYSLNIKMPGDFWLTIPFDRGYGLTGEQLKAEMKSKGNLTFKRDRAFSDYELTGTLVLTDNSSYKFLKEFKPVSGSIDFQGDLGNPQLDLKAEYIGSHSSDAWGDVKIVVNINGPKSDPRISFELWKESKGTGIYVKDARTPAEIQKDATYFLLTGNLADDNKTTTAEKISTTALASGLYSGANAIINQFLPTSAKEYIRTVGIEQGEYSQTKLKLTAALQGFTVKYGGSYGNNGQGSQQYTQDLSLEVPFSSFATFHGADNWLILIEEHLNSTSSGSLFQQPPYMGTLQYRFTP